MQLHLLALLNPKDDGFHLNVKELHIFNDRYFLKRLMKFGRIIKAICVIINLFSCKIPLRFRSLGIKR